MNKRYIAAAISAALTFGVLPALAQTTSTPAAPDPSVGGQASTKTPAGVPNPTQKSDGSMPNNRAAVKADARMDNMSPGNTKTPRGEASTMTNGVPNATPAVSAMTRADVTPTSRDLKPQAGKTGERPGVPTNPASQTGTPK